MTRNNHLRGKARSSGGTTALCENDIPLPGLRNGHFPELISIRFLGSIHVVRFHAPSNGATRGRVRNGSGFDELAEMNRMGLAAKGSVAHVVANPTLVEIALRRTPTGDNTNYGLTS